MEAVSKLEFAEGSYNDRLPYRSNSKRDGPTILARIAQKDTTAVRDCIECYGSFIWCLARKFTDSPHEAEAATEEIFNDIWRYRPSDLNTRTSEKNLIAAIALRRLMKRGTTCQNRER